MFMSYCIHQFRLFFTKKCLFSSIVVIRTLALCCRDNIRGSRDMYDFTLKDLVDLPRPLLSKMQFDKLFVGHCSVVLCLFLILCMFFAASCVLINERMNEWIAAQRQSDSLYVMFGYYSWSFMFYCIWCCPAWQLVFRLCAGVCTLNECKETVVL